MLDGFASIGIGIVLTATATYLARESKGLLIGEGARSGTMRSIRKIASEQPGVERVNDLITVHLAPDQVVAALSLEFKDELTTPQIENAVAAIESRICKQNPEVYTIFIKPQSSTTRDQRSQSAAVASA
jgi:divalent metal cation (Fe/Co/Zn/Cd) transporter